MKSEWEIDKSGGLWRLKSKDCYEYLVEGSRAAVWIRNGSAASSCTGPLSQEPLQEVCYFINLHRGRLQAKEGAALPSKACRMESRDPGWRTYGLPEGAVIDPGDRPLEVYANTGCGQDAVVLLDRTCKILFADGEVGRNVSVTGRIESYVQDLQKLMAHLHEVSQVMTEEGEMDISIVERCLALGRDILAGTAEQIGKKGSRITVSGHGVRISYDA